MGNDCGVLVPKIRGRSSSAMTRARRAWASSVASQVGRNRTGAGVSACGSGARGRSSSSAPSSARKRRVALQALGARPEADVHRRRVLRLQAARPLEHAGQRLAAALEQALAREDRAIELAR